MAYLYNVNITWCNVSKKTRFFSNKFVYEISTGGQLVSALLTAYGRGESEGRPLLADMGKSGSPVNVFRAGTERELCRQRFNLAMIS